jgi:biotin transport system substrate-specific component
MMNNNKTRQLCAMAIFTAVIAACAGLSFPLPHGVPITFQTFAIALAGIALGAKNGTLATLAYILLGAVGVPVFANFTGGVGVLAGPTGGFILSFPVISLAAGLGAKAGGKIRLALWLLAGVMVNYLCGMAYFAVVTSSNLYYAFMVCVLLYIPGDTVKLVLAVLLGKRIRNALAKTVIPY